MIGPNWAKGWIIEDNDIHDAKCSAVSIGKEESTGQNFYTLRDDKPGYQYQLESVFSARQIGWDKEHIGSHIIRRNHIYDCGQTGVVGHLGCVFSTIEDNDIHDIAVKREFYGYEIGGIKLHAAIDVTIEHNRFHNCSLGTWLDWQTQGTRVTRNVYYNNSRDLFVEVSHGPYVVDNNIFASPASIETFSQGGAYINNLILGAVRFEPVFDRATPYHREHSTQVAGYAVIYGGDDRFIGNIFAASDTEPYEEGGQGPADFSYGTSVFDGHPASLAEYLEIVGAAPDSDHGKYPSVKQPVYVRNNTYVGGAAPYAREINASVYEGGSVGVEVDGSEVYIAFDVPEGALETLVPLTTGPDLEPARFVGLGFSDRSGGTLVIDKDINGNLSEVGSEIPVGPLATLTAQETRYKVW